MDNFMRNMKMVNYCWTCNKEHEIGDRDVHEHSIMCECGGYVVSPSGKVQFTFIPVVHVFKVCDGENHWIAAKDQEEVKTAYQSIYEEELEEGADIEKVTPDIYNKSFITTEEGRKVSLLDIIRDTNKFPALLASSVW